MNKKLLFLSAFAVFIHFGCKREAVDSQIVIEPEFTDEELAAIDTMDNTRIPMDSVMLPNGEMLLEFMRREDPDWIAQFRGDPFVGKDALTIKSIIAGRFIKMADNLVDKSRFQYESEGANKPKQYGLAYSYGRYDFKNRYKPKFSKCTYEIYGLDCSGMIYNVYQAAGLNIPHNIADVLRKTKTIEEGLSKYSATAARLISIEDLGKIKSKDIQSGDIIYWLRDNGTASHIAVGLRKDMSTPLKIYMSSGKPNDCELNLSKGPRTVTVNDSYWFAGNQNWGVVRMQVKDSNNQNINCSSIRYDGRIISGGAGGCARYIMIFSGGVQPYTYSMDRGVFGIDNNTISACASGNHVLIVKDANGCKFTHNFYLP